MFGSVMSGRHSRHAPLRIARYAPHITACSWLLALATLFSALAVALAALRHTGSLAFPIDDAYIYSNYVLAASQGHPFTYNLGETSGGITSLGWYILGTLFYWLLTPLHALLGGLAPPTVQPNALLAQQAGHLYLAAYLPGVLGLAFTALGVYRLAQLTLPAGGAWREAFCWLLGSVAVADLGLLWGAMSGLEVSLAAAVAVWAICLLIQDARAGRLRWSLLLAAVMPWARPDMAAIGIAGVLWLAGRGLARQEPAGTALRKAALYAGALLLGLTAMSAFYYAGWSQPLPSSFYAKVGGLRLGGKFFAAAQEFQLAGRFLPFIVAALSLAGGLLTWLWTPREQDREARREVSLSAALLLLASMGYVAALMLTLPWFGQEERYLLPVHPYLIVLLGMLAWRLLRLVPLDRLVIRPALALPAGLLVVLVFAGADYLWATRVYAVEVRNIADAHVAPALWLRSNAPPGSLVASEPIGAVKLFSGRPTIDLVGLTTPATLGTYGDWPRAWQALHQAGAAYLLYYPRWFDNAHPPAWAVQQQAFNIPDNRIVGDSLIAVYSLQWNKYDGQRLRPLPMTFSVRR